MPAVTGQASPPSPGWAIPGHWPMLLGGGEDTDTRGVQAAQTQEVLEFEGSVAEGGRRKGGRKVLSQ